ncbi:MAG: dual specificity protein phosphatase family protein [Planctomycetaceae bacterium]|nr:dual specificity protein phosphatase family protein [Planctomycetaceae bacterium]
MPLLLSDFNAQSLETVEPPKSSPRKWYYMILGMLICITLLVVWRKNYYYDFFPKRWAVVYAGELYRSGQLSSSLVDRVLMDNQIDLVVDLTGVEPGNQDQAAESEVCKKMLIEHHRFPLKGDGTGDLKTYASAVHCIDQAIQNKKRVLVHCAAGIHRTGGVLAMYKLHVRGESPESVTEGLEEFGFWDEGVNAKLIPFLNHNRKALAEEVRKTGSTALNSQEVPLLGEHMALTTDRE